MARSMALSQATYDIIQAVPLKPSDNSIFGTALAFAGVGLGVFLAKGKTTWVPQNCWLAPALLSTGGIIALWAIWARKNRMLHIIGVAHRAQSQRPGVTETAAQQDYARRLMQTFETFIPRSSRKKTAKRLWPTVTKIRLPRGSVMP
jgi:hypothetical protein